MVFEFYAKNKDECDKSYAKGEDVEIGNIYNDVNDRDEIDLLLVKTDIVIITANKYEKNLLHKNVYESLSVPYSSKHSDLKKTEKQKIKRFDIELPTASEKNNKIYGYYFIIDDKPVLNLHANVTGSYTIGGSADLVRWIISNKMFYPSLIISFGICFGLMEKKTQLGNVIISNKIYPYFVGSKVQEDKLYVVDDNMFHINSTLSREMSTLISNNVFNILPCKVRFGNYSTGEAVVSSQKLREAIKSTTTQDVFAGDMEAYGLFKECNSYNKRVPCITIKAICDWGIDKNFNIEDKKTINSFKSILNKYIDPFENEEDYKLLLDSLKDRIQSYAAQCAFDFLYVFISKSSLCRSSMYETIKRRIEEYNGEAISDLKLRDLIYEIVEDQGFGYICNTEYVKKITLLLNHEGLLAIDEKISFDEENVYVFTIVRKKD